MILNFLKEKWFYIVSLIIIIGIALFIIKKQNDILKRQADIEKSVVEQKQIEDNIIRSQAKYAVKEDLESFAKKLDLNLDAIKNDMKTLNASIIGINNSTVSTKGLDIKNIPSTSTIPKPEDPKNPDAKIEDKYGYLRNAQVLKFEEPFSGINVPIGTVTFSAWEKNPWALNLLPRDYSMTTVIGTDEEGRHYTYNKMSITTDGKTYPINITKSNFIEQYPESKFFSWNPRLALGFDSGFNLGATKASMMPGLHVSFMSYGKTKNSSDWMFLQTGIGYDFIAERPAFILTPAAYNFGKQLNPLLQNTYIAPSISLNTAGDFVLGVGLRVGL